MRHISLITCLALLAAGHAGAAEPSPPVPDDLDALSIADETKDAPAPSKPASWRVFGEGAYSHGWLRDASPNVKEARASVDLRYDGRVMPTLRAVLSNRLDVTRDNTVQRNTSRNTLREAYLSWHANPELIVDLGRVNLRYGAAMGYNPTDYFKGGAVRSVVSPDPASLRENRQGTVLLQGQKLWSATSLTAALSPKLGDRPSDSSFAMNFGATNPRNRWLLSASHRFTENINPQIVLHGGEDTPTQAGLNLSGLLNKATVAYLEFSAGKGRSLIADTLGLVEPKQTQQRAALGMTYTTGFNLTLTTEAQYNSAAPDRNEWNAFRNGGPAHAPGLLATALTQQELPVRQALFLHAVWRDMGIRNLDLSGFVRQDIETHSREQWIETRYHWKKAEVALQWQQFSGDDTSLYGSIPYKRRVGLLLRYFL